MKTIAQQLNIKSFPFEIKDANGKQVYFEYSDGYWHKWEYDANGNKVYYENSKGTWYKSEYDSNSKEVYFENSNGYWVKYEYDANSKLVYYENSKRFIVDNRPKPVKEFSMDEIAKAMGIPVNQLKIRK